MFVLFEFRSKTIVNIAVLTPRNTFNRWHPFLKSIQKIFSEHNLNIFFLVSKRNMHENNLKNISPYHIFTPNLKHTALEASSLNNLRTFFLNNKVDWVHIIGEPNYLHTYNICKLKDTFNYKVSCRMAQNVSQSWPFPFSYIEKFSLQKLDVIFPVSKLSNELLINKKYRNRVEYLNNGVDHIAFKDQKLEKKFDLLYVGKVLERKGIYNIRSVLKDINSKKIRIAFCFSGGEEKKINEFIKSLPDMHEITVFRNVKHKELSQIYNSSKFLIAPSKYSDGSDWSFGKYFPFLKIKWLEQFSMVAAESMSCGVPVIHTNSGALPEVVDNSNLMAREDDPESLKKVIEYALDLSKEEYSEMCLAAKSVAVDYRWDEISLKFLKTIRDEL